MATYYVGPGGNDANAGTSWALRKLTLNGAEDIPVAAGDTVYVGPGVYREQLTVDVAGNAGNPITYIGDVTGENTDAVGGIVRITPSDDDLTATRTYAITAASLKDYRTFRGFFMDLAGSAGVLVNIFNSDHWIIEDCVLDTESLCIFVNSTATNITIRRCLFIIGVVNYFSGIWFTHSSPVDNANHLIENCVFLGMGRHIVVTRIGGIVVRNCVMFGGWYAVFLATVPNVGQTLTVNNCLICYGYYGTYAAGAGYLVEDYNAFHGNNTDRFNTAVGGNSNAYPPIFLPPVLNSGESQVSGYKIPWWFSELSEWSQVQAITGTNEPTEDLRGQVRPTTAAKNSWGAVQFHDMERDTGTVRTGTASMTFNDAGVQAMWVPHSGAQITVSVYVQREANYAGNNPQMVIKQPGQADRTTADTGAASAWNELTDTFTPAADPEYVVVELQSLNTAAAGNYACYFDDLTVT